MVKAAVTWLDHPEAHDYPAAASYLSLIARQPLVDELVSRLKAASVQHFKAKDILRAARLPLLEVDNAHVASDLQKVRSDKPLSPILMVRGSITTGHNLVVADGYHRVCASYHIDENTDIPVVLVDMP